MELDARLTKQLAAGSDAGSDPTDAQFRLLVESVVDYAIFLLDTSGRVMSWNTGAQRIKGLSVVSAIRHFGSRSLSATRSPSGTPFRR